ncbi:hypothetical protein EW026_g1017 [Hermanssonia centrifuga]|uniref:Uncharacterized protein n=1 Tax=Hermanssonia centrifuga TaxID=98765 RepID=A0A4S4KSX9_9APHY|nr:hypothetical protein EW026_g1017 [Hermanssonia centrifuga]
MVIKTGIPTHTQIMTEHILKRTDVNDDGQEMIVGQTEEVLAAVAEEKDGAEETDLGGAASEAIKENHAIFMRKEGEHHFLVMSSIVN